MNEREAIEQLKLEITDIKGMTIDCDRYVDFAEKTISSFNMAIAALEKQVAKKPVKADVQPYIRKKFAGRYNCPACNREVERRWNGCPYCLQRLKWEE